jgi:hypothetical protein
VSLVPYFPENVQGRGEAERVVVRGGRGWKVDEEGVGQSRVQDELNE